jgi:HlyD family secretion protein
MLMTSPLTVAAGMLAGLRVPRGSAVASAVALTAAAVMASGWFYFSLSEAPSATAYETGLIGRGLVERTISATGPVKALVTVDVGSQLSGLIVEMKVDFNDSVEEGELLAVIDRAPFDAKVASARANLAIARAEVGEKEAAVVKAATQLAQAKRDLARNEALAPKGYASHVQRDHAETQYGSAKADLAIAQAELESAKATVALRQADLTQAEIDLGYTLIRSPINGVIVDRRMQPGQTVAAQYQTPILFQIAQDLSQILIYAQIDEADVGMVRPGDGVTFTVEAYPDDTFEGVVDQVRLAATKVAGVITYTAVIRAENRNLRLFPDMTASVRVVTDKQKDVLFVPNQATQFRPRGFGTEGAGETSGSDQEYVTVLAAHGAGPLRPRPVRLGLQGDHVTEIIEGDIKEGDSVVLRAKGAAERCKP